MANIEIQIREIVKKLFEDGKIELFIGYKNGTLPMNTTPYFMTNKDEVDSLIFNPYCGNNLAAYLPRFFESGNSPKIGIIAKGCDARSIVGLIKELQVPRENLVIVGIGCEGMIDQKKIKGRLNGLEVASVEEKEKELSILDNRGKSHKFNKMDVLFSDCLVCQHSVPAVYDFVVGEDRSPKTLEDKIVVEFESKPLEERWEYFKNELSKCIRCYACRQACPNCYCKRCFAEQTRPKWQGVTDELSEIIFYHMGRIFHQAGRCVDCGACERSCPMDIKLRLFTKQLSEDVKELFKYEAGLSIEEAPPLIVFKETDTQEFVTEAE